MKRSTMLVLVGLCLCLVLGVLLGKAGLDFDNWLYWAFIGAIAAYGGVRREEGYNRRKEVLARAAMETFCDFLLKTELMIMPEAAANTEDSGASDG